MKLRVVISGRHYDWAQALGEELTLPDGASLDDALAALAAGLPHGRQLPPTCLVALAGRHLGTIGNHRGEPPRDGDELLLFTPVAGG
jgi:molybdopterin converting factor small subunit